MTDSKNQMHDFKLICFRGGLLFVAASLIFGIRIAHSAVNSSWSPSSAVSSPAARISDDSASRRGNRSTDSTSVVSPFSPNSNNFSLDLGQVFLMGDLSRYSNSIGAQLHYTYGVSDLFAFDTSLGYSEHSDGQYSMTSALAGMRGNLSWFDKLVPYAILGVGFYRPSYQQNPAVSPAGAVGIPSSSSISSVLFGVHMGPGLDLQLTRSLFFGASLTLHNLFGTTRILDNGTGFYMGGAYISFFAHTGYTF